MDFGFPRGELRGGRELVEGYLPLLRSWWRDGAVCYEFETILDALDGDLQDIECDDPTLLLGKIRAANVSDGRAARAELRLSTDTAGPEDLAIEGLLALAPFRGERRVRFVVDFGGRGELAKEGKACRWSLELGPGEGHTVWIAIPSITIAGPQEIEAVRRRSFERDSARALAYWRALTARGSRISTGEPWLDGFYRSHLRHLLVNCVREPGSDRLHAHVGTFHYGVFPDESCMMVSDLDRRGFHREAERCLESFLRYQGTAPLPGNFSSTEGLFYGSGGHEMGGYNKSHGWVLWCLAEHWRFTRDREWMARAAPGMESAARALEEFGHKEAGRLGEEARWILSDYEDNLYVSDLYGYAIPAFDRFWFSRGGFSMQANLLGGPLPYLFREEIRHFLRAYFNGFASAFYPEIRMLNEHSLPELGYPAGDHFKSSDEAQSTYWLRLMFVHERKGDLYFAQAIPRYWLEDGKSVSIERAPSHFGPLSLRIASHVASGWMEAALDPPKRNPPGRIYLRFRHPEAKPIRSAELDGHPRSRFDPAKEWVALEGKLAGPRRVVVRY